VAKPDSSDSRTPAPVSARPELEALVRSHGGWLLDFLRRRFGREAAEELAQETYVRLARSDVEIRNPKALLAVAALNAARDLARRRAVRPRLVADDAFAAAASAASQTELVLLKQVVLSLPHHVKVVFCLSRFAGMTYEEIAQHCGISVKTVEARMSKALRICAMRLRA
jgi:RNA polymerase sigma-70 factor (ECF subfamily)